MEYLEQFRELSVFVRSLITFVIAMVPVVELRGAIPAGVILGLHPLLSAGLSIVGNMVPIPIIILFARRIFIWMKKKSKILGRFARWLEAKAESKGGVLQKGELIGLMLFVAIPLPGTGAWTGALIAVMLDIRMKKAVPAIAAGVVIAGILIAGLTSGFSAIF